MALQKKTVIAALAIASIDDSQRRSTSDINQDYPEQRNHQCVQSGSVYRCPV